MISTKTLYRKQQVVGASPVELVAMLTQEARRLILQAKQALEREAAGEAHGHLLRAQDIIYELRLSVNQEAGEVAGNLVRLYDFVLGGLIEANIKKRADRLDALAEVLHTLSSGWRSIENGMSEA